MSLALICKRGSAYLDLHLCSSGPASILVSPHISDARRLQGIEYTPARLAIEYPLYVPSTRYQQ